MFQRKPNPTFSATVLISTPGAASQPVTMVFKHRTHTELSAFLATADGRTDKQFWADMIDHIPSDQKAEGESDEAFLTDITENYPAANSDILRTYMRELAESRLKN